MVLLIMFTLFIYLGLSLYSIHTFGQPMKDGYIGLSILNDAIQRTHASNVVTSIVFGYRGYDTLGEATIFFVAVLGFYWTMSRMKGGKDSDDSSR